MNRLVNNYTNVSYQRVDHFLELVKCFEEPSDNNILNELNTIINELKSNNLIYQMNNAELTLHTSKYLKRNRIMDTQYTKYVIFKIKNNQLPLDEYTVVRLKNLFIQFNQYYNNNYATIRKNFLNYSFIIYKLLGLIDKKEYQEYFPLLRNKDKQKYHNDIWDKICKDLGWNINN